MTLAEYYNFPAGTNCFMRYFSRETEILEQDIPQTISLERFFSYIGGMNSIPDFINCKATNLSYFAHSTSVYTFDGLETLDTSEVTDFSYLCNSSQLRNTDAIKNWNTSSATNMKYMFPSSLVVLDVNWDTSKVTDMNQMVAYDNLRSLCALDCSSVAQNKYPFTSYSDMKYFTDAGGFINMKSSWTNNGLIRCPNLTYQSCINILNGLYNFEGHGETPSSSQGKLKVHANFLSLVGDEISIGTNKGWTITT